MSIEKVILSFITLLICGCAAKPLTSHLTGTCKVIIQPQQIFNGRNSQYWGHFKIANVGNKKFIAKGDKVYGSLDIGTRIKIFNILKNRDWGWGEFLRVQMEILDGPHAGLIADIPACVPYHPRPRWVEVCTLDPDALVFNDEIVKNCEQILEQ